MLDIQPGARPGTSGFIGALVTLLSGPFVAFSSLLAEHSHRSASVLRSSIHLFIRPPGDSVRRYFEVPIPAAGRLSEFAR